MIFLNVSWRAEIEGNNVGNFFKACQNLTAIVNSENYTRVIFTAVNLVYL